MSSSPDGAAESSHAVTTVKADYLHLPLPEIPLPNDMATIYDPTSATQRRINASMIAPTEFERFTRERLDQLDGWSIFGPITIPFTGPLDLQSILNGHRDKDYDLSNDVVYLINIDRRSPEFGKPERLDVGNGNYPVTLKNRERFWDNDPRAGLVSLMFEEADEDVNHNGILDPGEDTDGDGVLDVPNYFLAPGTPPLDYKTSHPAARTDALTSYYERETNTLILRPMETLRERTTYAVVVTRRLLDSNGAPVGSPYSTINDTAQTEALKPLPEVLQPLGLSLSDVAFAFTFTTQSVESHWRAVRDGLYGYGAQAHLAREYPPDVTALLPGRDAKPGVTFQHLVYGEQWRNAIQIIGPAFLGLDKNSEVYKLLLDSFKYVDYFVIGRYESPQLFRRVADYCPAPSNDPNAPNDAENVLQHGPLLPLNAQSWPPDLDRVPAEACAETIYFTVAVPRKEVSARGQNQPAPVILLGHGYTGQRFSIMQYAGYFAEHGLATIAIDGPSHGINATKDQVNQAKLILSAMGLTPFTDATFKDRAFDQNGDGVKDSGADFWTTYLFHTRDIVRQFMLDNALLMRIVRGFDGKRTWNFDLGDGQTHLAGDFDGDGHIDIGGDAPIIASGGSLGGIMSMLLGGAEPQISTIVPISGGGGYMDIGTRSLQGGVVEAFILRVMGPLFVGTIDQSTGTMPIQTIVPQLTGLDQPTIGTIAGVQPGDTMVAENLRNGERGCGLVSPEGRVRASLPSDRYDPIRIVFYQGPVQLPQEGCFVGPSAVVRGVLETFGQDVQHQTDHYKAGDPLVALEDGLGKARATPDLRRLNLIAQTAIDPGDPVAYARFLQREPLTFATGEHTGAHAVVLTSAGDMNVTAASGVTFGRVAGLIDYLNAPQRTFVDRVENQTFTNLSDNEMLIETYAAEGVDNLERHHDPTGKGVLLDVENFSEGDDLWGPNYPRLDPPLRIGVGHPDRLGNGYSAAFFSLIEDTGRHGFGSPGEVVDRVRAQCRNQCTETGGSDPCGCKTLQTFDIGTFLISMLGDYAASDGKTLDLDLCHSRGDCPNALPVPPARNVATLP